MRRSLYSVLGSLTVLLWTASFFCQGAPIRDKNKPNGFVGMWKKFTEKPLVGPATARAEYQNADESQSTQQNRSIDTGGFLSPSRSSFSWEAFIHGPTGVASSNERSGPFSLTTKNNSPWSLLRKSNSPKVADSGSSQLEEEELKQQIMREEEQLIVETSRQFVDAWSDFLCQGTISLGILRCEKQYSSNKKAQRKARWPRRMKPRVGLAAPHNNTAVSSSLMARFTTFPVKLLEFGNPVESTSPSFIYEQGVKENDKNSPVILGSWDIPLQGGGLVLEEDEPEKQNSGSSNCSVGRDCHGKLMFAIVKTRRVPDENKGGSYIESSDCGNTYEIITGIRNYRPWLAGGGYTEDTRKHENIWDALKANRETTTGRLCHGFYLSTQSMVHAYVTWRFHHAWKKELATAIQTSMKTANEKESS